MAIRELSAVTVETNGDGLAWVTMNRPDKRNAMNRVMNHEMYQVLDELDDDEEIRVVILTGAGSAFSSGVDLKDRWKPGEPRGKDGAAEIRNTNWKFDRLYNLNKITIAMVNGWCVGGAFTQLLACDLAIAAEEAKFSLSEVNFGAIPGGMVTKLLADSLRPRDALYSILTAESFDGRHAAEIGLVNSSVPLESLREATAELAQTILSKSPAAVIAAKQAFRAVRSMTLADAGEYLRAKSVQLRATDPNKGSKQGLTEFLDNKSFKPAMEAMKANPETNLKVDLSPGQKKESPEEQGIDTSPLAGVKVVELANVISGPYAGTFLVDFGAEVTKVEMPETGDPYRKWDANSETSGSSFDAINRGKKSITLDLKTPLGQDAVKRLVAEADVVIENFRPHLLDKLGLGFEDLKKVNPSIIYCSLIGLHFDGVRPVYDSIPFAQSGLWSQFTDMENPSPIGPGLADHLSGMNAAMAIVAAIVRRSRVPEAQHLEVSMLGSCVAMSTNAIAHYVYEGNIADNKSRPHTSQAYSLVCADKKPIAIHLSSPPKFWISLVTAIGQPELAVDPRFKSKADRIKAYDVIHDILASAFLTKSRDEWLKILTEADVPVAPLLGVSEVIDDELVKSLGMFTEFGSGDRSYTGITFPARTSWKQNSDRLPPPRLGEHNLTVLSNLGYSDEEIAEVTALKSTDATGPTRTSK